MPVYCDLSLASLVPSAAGFIQAIEAFVVTTQSSIVRIHADSKSADWRIKHALVGGKNETEAGDTPSPSHHRPGFYPVDWTSMFAHKIWVSLSEYVRTAKD